MNLRAKKMPQGGYKMEGVRPQPCRINGLFHNPENWVSCTKPGLDHLPPLNRHAEISKTMSLSSNGKRHYLQANSGRQPSPSTASRKRHLQRFKSRFAFHDRRINLEGTPAPVASVVFQSLKAAQFPFQYKERWNPQPLPRQPIHCNQHSCPWHKAGVRAAVPGGGQTTGQGCRAWLPFPQVLLLRVPEKAKLILWLNRVSKRPTSIAKLWFKIHLQT